MLIKYAYELGQAESYGDEERIKIARENHYYKELCLKSDKMIIGFKGDL